MRKFVILCSLAALVVLGGCKGHSIVGAWNVTSSEGQGGKATFDASGGFKGEVDMQGVHATITGTYKEEKDQLTITATNLEAATADKAKQAQWDMMKAKIMPDLLKQINQDPTGKIEWKSNDEFTVSKSKGSTTYTKIKE